MPADRKRASAPAGCPLCRKPPADQFRPFCSRGCRDRDLLGWMGESYRVADRSSEEDELAPSSDEQEL
ncbi:MAG TPA: DNA gyrase inhibitor YacG [Sphingobium sp.]|nr:DNA gyrase inhibitor YacG [Sphingobium sp.]